MTGIGGWNPATTAAVGALVRELMPLRRELREAALAALEEAEARGVLERGALCVPLAGAAALDALAWWSAAAAVVPALAECSPVGRVRALSYLRGALRLANDDA